MAFAGLSSFAKWLKWLRRFTVTISLTAQGSPNTMEQASLLSLKNHKNFGARSWELRKIKKTELHPDNPFWADVLKFDIALSDSYIGDMITVEYVREKLKLILIKRASWHSRVEAVYTQILDGAE